MDEEKSLSDYTDEIWRMLVELLYKDDGFPVNYEDTNINDCLYNTFDLWFGHLDNMVSGRCSIAQSLEFDLHEEVMSKHKEITSIYKHLKPKN